MPEELPNWAADENVERRVVKDTDNPGVTSQPGGEGIWYTWYPQWPTSETADHSLLFHKQADVAFLQLERFFHYGISRDGRYERDGHEAHARILEGYVRQRNGENAMELGSGLSPNIAFLASRNPRVAFNGVDLSNKPLHRHTKLPNARFWFGITTT